MALPMRLIRHLTPQGPAYAALQPDGSAREVVGDLYGDLKLGSRTVTPGKLLAPVEPTNLLCIGLNYKKHAAESNLPEYRDGALLYEKHVRTTMIDLTTNQFYDFAGIVPAWGDREPLYLFTSNNVLRNKADRA